MYLILTVVLLITGHAFGERCSNCVDFSDCPVCCCFHPNIKAGICCRTNNTSFQNVNQNDELKLDSGFLYFIAGSSVIIIIIIGIVCCSKMTTKTKCVHIMRLEPRATRTNISSLYTDDTNDVSAYHDMEMSGIQIDMPKCPPYAENPPSYLEATANPTDLPAIDYNNELNFR